VRAPLGLRYGIVELSDYRPAWEQAFQSEGARVVAALAGVSCRVEHIGSTAVPGSVAKPILDIGVGVSAPSTLEDCFAPLEGLGYRYRGDAGSSGGHVFVRQSEEWVRTHHIHVVHVDDPQWDAYLLFRDYLRQSEGARRAYGAEKRRLAELFPSDRKAYSAGKEAVVSRVLEEAARSRARN
jgi:GrpB-like predicted nucleotidyltransferase (UPF0157 family)